MRKIAYIPLALEPERFVDYSAYKELFGYDNSYQFYGAFYKGQQVGYGASKDGKIVHVAGMDPEVDQGLEGFMQQYGDHATISATKGKDPKDQINAPIPFIFDVHKKHIQIGYEGEHTRDIQPYRGEFSKGGIVEGEYQPGGKMIVYPSNTALYTTRSIQNTWMQQFPQMEVTGIEMEADGKTHKIAAGMYAPNDVLDHIYNIHRLPQEWEDDEYEDDPDMWNATSEEVHNYPQYRREMVPINNVLSYGYSTDPSRVSEYAKQNPTTMPELVLDHNYGILDGEHRYAGAVQRGDTHVPAYVGVPDKTSAMDPGQYVRVLASADPAAANAKEALTFAGGKVYAVGGAVRDALRGESPKDIDLMVAGLPADEVDNILSKLPGRVDLTGKRFGVYRYRHDGHEVEIALPRQDKYETSRRGEGVITVDHNLPLDKDLQRRDFTINSMAVDLDSGAIIDPYGGQNDLEKNLLRTTHPDSFREDPTRLVRALTAHGRFGVHPDEETRSQMASNAHLLRGESPDALNQQLDKTFGADNPNPAASMRLAHETGVLKHLFPEVDDNWDYDQKNPHHNHTLGEHTMHVLGNASKLTPDPDVRMAAMLHDIGKPGSAWNDPVTGKNHYFEKRLPNGQVLGANHEALGAQMANDRLSQFNYPKARINRVTHLIQHHMFAPFDNQMGARRFINRVGDEHADDLMHLRQADSEGKGTGAPIDPHSNVDLMREQIDQVRKAQQPTDLNNLAINGDNVLSLGVQPGPQVGQILRNLLDHVIDVPTDNNPAKLMELAKGYIR